jgi:alkylhydroperoxidase/carboxymuconolactone decarboxylase family protein YurZ
MAAREDTGVLLGCFASALVLQDNVAACLLLAELRAFGVEREAVRETILETYLFDGYPTALEGMALLAEKWPGEPEPVEKGEYDDWNRWRERGRKLYRQIYGEVADRLQERATQLSPELASWMIVEGYGKVLSRGGLDLATRELIAVSVLAVKRRPRQLHSHLRGSLRAGVARGRIALLLRELRSRYAGSGIDDAETLFSRV